MRTGKVPSVVPIDMDGNGYFLAQDFDTFANLYWRPPYGRARILKLPSNVNVNGIQNVSQIEMVAGANRNGRILRGVRVITEFPVDSCRSRCASRIRGHVCERGRWSAE